VPDADAVVVIRSLRQRFFNGVQHHVYRTVADGVYQRAQPCYVRFYYFFRQFLFGNNDDASRFLKMIELYQDSAGLQEIPSEVLDTLKTMPEYVPALMVAASVSMLNDRKKEAIAQYETVLKQYPDFAQVRARLAELYASNEQTKEKAYQFATEARVTLPDDAELARTLGILLSERGDHQYASSLLEESIAKLPPDARAHYYLGMCRYRLDEKEKAIQSLTKALELSPDAPYSEKAKELIAELAGSADQ